MGTRPKFTFDPPQEIYAMRYAEVVREIAEDLFKWRHQVIEEIGLTADRVEVLGSLPTYVTGSSFVITPVVALVQPDFRLQPNPYEVDDVFEVPLAYLMDPVHHRRHVYEFDGVAREWYSMPYQDGDAERFIWGATAGMLRNFYRLLIT